jgi:hypothetical protein
MTIKTCLKCSMTYVKRRNESRRTWAGRKYCSKNGVRAMKDCVAVVTEA